MADQKTPDQKTPDQKSTGQKSTGGGQHTAGAFDIRNIIGALIGLYGVVLTVMGLFADPETAKTGGVNANLWAGIGMLVVGLAFLAWARLKPIVVPEHPAGPGPDADAGPAGDGDRPRSH